MNDFAMLILAIVLMYAAMSDTDVDCASEYQGVSACISGVVYEVVDGEIVAQLDAEGGPVLCQEWDDE